MIYEIYFLDKFKCIVKDVRIGNTYEEFGTNVAGHKPDRAARHYVSRRDFDNTILIE